MKHSSNKERLEVLRNAAVALLREDGRVLDPRVPSRRHVPYDGLPAAAVPVVIGPRLVVGVGVVAVVCG